MDEKTKLTEQEREALKAHTAICKAPRGGKTAVKKAWARKMGVSPATLERRIMRLVGRQRPTVRADSWQSKIPDVGEWVKRVVNVTMSAALTDGRRMSTREAIAECEGRGLIPRGLLKASSVDRIAREMNLDVRNLIRVALELWAAMQ